MYDEKLTKEEIIHLTYLEFAKKCIRNCIHFKGYKELFNAENYVDARKNADGFGMFIFLLCYKTHLILWDDEEYYYDFFSVSRK